jgi:hypothetical protein
MSVRCQPKIQQFGTSSPSDARFNPLWRQIGTVRCNCDVTLEKDHPSRLMTCSPCCGGDCGGYNSSDLTPVGTSRPSRYLSLLVLRNSGGRHSTRGPDGLSQVISTCMSRAKPGGLVSLIGNYIRSRVSFPNIMIHHGVSIASSSPFRPFRFSSIRQVL